MVNKSNILLSPHFSSDIHKNLKMHKIRVLTVSDKKLNFGINQE